RGCELGGVDDAEGPAARMAREGGAECRLLRLAVHLLDERPRHLREGVTARSELRRADRALAGAAGALLAPRLRAAARDHAAALRLCSTGAAEVRLRAHGLVHEVRLDLGGEDGLLERDVLRLLALCVEEGSRRRH